MILWVGLAALAGTAFGQPPAPSARMTFKEAVAQAIERNPSVQEAAKGILRAEALLRQATSSFGSDRTSRRTTRPLAHQLPEL